MDEITDSSNKKNSILLSRNKPVALIVGVAGFLGSHLAEKLLEKGTQVVGVDNLKKDSPRFGEAGSKENLRKAIEDKDFHLVINSAEQLDFDLPRLDYLFIVSSGGYNLENILELFKKSKCRLLFASSIDLYEKENNSTGLAEYKNTESKIANYARDFHLNARILRLGSVFGPRMHFKSRDPLIKLIQQSLNGDLQKNVALEFSSRAIYITDAVDLMIKTMFAGSTAQKIFDGVKPSPVQISEVKQVLLDPVWYEQREFTFSELPPWPTPNLDKTIKILNWHPNKKLVASLRETLSYFKDNEIDVPRVETEREEEQKKADEGWKKGKEEDLKSFKEISQDMPKSAPKFPLALSKVYFIIIFLLVSYALIWPMLVLGWGVFTFRSQLGEALNNLQAGEFEKSLENVGQAEIGAKEAKSIFDSLEPIRKTGLLKNEFEAGDNLTNLADLSSSSVKSTILGVQALFQSLKAVTGESTDNPEGYFNTAQVELNQASEDLSKTSAIIESDDFGKKVPLFLSQKVVDFSDRLKLYTKLVNKAQALSVLLPKIVAINGAKDYLVLLQNNMELRPGGGFIGSFARISFEGGKLKKIDVNDIYNIDGNLSIHVEPPKEIKEDLDQKDWFLRDSNWESDFPTSARQSEWFYTKETGLRVEGVVALDISAMESLIGVIGSLDLPDYKENITSENLFERAVSHSELSFFPGSQAKKSFLTALTNQLFNKIFFLPQNNWPGIISALGRSLDEKHISIYLNDPKLFSYLSSQSWTHALPRQSKENAKQDFLSLVEANLGANKVNYYLDRSYNLETVVGKNGEIAHRMRISYTNKSPSGAFPGGKYKNRMRIYLPFGTKMTRALWGETDITKTVTSFVDYGRSGYSMLLELFPKEQKTLVLDYAVPVKLEFNDGKASYRLDIIKQPGTPKDPLTWNLSYPISYQVISEQTKANGPQEQTIATDLSVDRSFEVEFQK